VSVWGIDNQNMVLDATDPLASAAVALLSPAEAHTSTVMRPIPHGWTKQKGRSR
jgi:hypothetical protein